MSTTDSAPVKDFAEHADEALELANAAFETGAETWPGPGYWGCPRCRGRLEADGYTQAPGGLACVQWICPGCNIRPSISIFVEEAP